MDTLWQRRGAPSFTSSLAWSCISLAFITMAATGCEEGERRNADCAAAYPKPDASHSPHPGAPDAEVSAVDASVPAPDAAPDAAYHCQPPDDDASVPDGERSCVFANAELTRAYVGPFLVDDKHFYAWTGDRYRSFFVRAVNIGATYPGEGPTALDIPSETWLRWFQWMSTIGFNSLRLYQLQSPDFYRSLRDYNNAHADQPLYIIQGTYLSEQSGTYLPLTTLSERFDAEVQAAVDAIHGNRTIAQRSGTGWGTFDADVSPWTLAWLPGREVLANEVLATDRVKDAETTYEGSRLRVTGTPTEVWKAARIDHQADYELRHYGSSRPIAWSSWMQLDPLIHPTEGKASGQDIAQVDLGRIDAFGLEAGYFVSYHAYPYYPNFVSEAPEYQMYSDELGPNSYHGLLQALRDHHQGVALFVAEFGVPSSWGRAHSSFSGMHHGGLDQAQQGTFAGRMMRDICQVGAAGGSYFQWTDGWWKRIWITNPVTFPAERLRFWHDMMNAQQHYGLVEYALDVPNFDASTPRTGTGRIAELRSVFDAEFVHLRIKLTSAISPSEQLVIGLDTYADDRGETRLPNGARTSRRNEFALSIQAPDSAELKVLRSYDLFEIRKRTPPASAVFRSTASDTGDWSAMHWEIAAAHQDDYGLYQFPAETFPIGQLKVRNDAAPSTLDAVAIDGATVTVKLPWTLLNFTDPTQRMVMDDDPKTTQRETQQTPGIAFSVSIADDMLETPRHGWDTWKVAPATTARLKQSAATLTDWLAELPGR